MGAEVGKIFQGALEKNGVKFYMEAGVEKAVASDSDSSKVGGIALKDGTTLPADRKCPSSYLKCLPSNSPSRHPRHWRWPCNPLP